MHSNSLKLCGLMVVVGLSGCQMLTPQTALNVVESDDVEPFETLPIAPHLFSPDGEYHSVDVSELQPGQKVQVLMGEPEESPLQWKVSDDIMAGTVQEITADSLVLGDIVQVTYAVSEQDPPMLRHVPYVSRLFKNTAIGATAAHIPGTIHLPRKDVLSASVLTEQAYQSLWNGETPRIGIDFDFVADTSVE